MSQVPLKIAVVSDLHFVNSKFIKDSNHHSWLAFEADGSFNDNFWQSLLNKIKDENIKADLLVCPGDISTHAEKSALEFAWVKLEELARALDCDILATATGNHDVCSRNQSLGNTIRDLENNHSLVENLKQLSPPYPLLPLKEEDDDSHHNRIQYFGSDFLIYDKVDNYRLVIFNSCSIHTSDPVDYERGFIADSALQWLEKSLKSTHDPKNKKLGIFVCHHHPIQHSDHNLGTYDFIKGGTQLIEMLNRYGNWIIIHGHKHHAKLSYYSDGSKKTIVFAAGTLSSHKRTLGTEFANQFYIVEADPNKTKGTPQGTLDVYSWRGTHWSLSKRKNDGVFTGVGFGDAGCMEELAEKISSTLNNVTKTAWDSLVESFPELKHCVPKDLEHLATHLQEYDVDFVYSGDSEIEGLERSKA